jgi:hypothetical protein
VSRTWRAWLRSVTGQLALLLGTFAGAVMLAVVIVCLRGPVFEKYVRETYPDPDDWSVHACQTLASARATSDDCRRVGEQIEEHLGKEPPPRRAAVLERIYGAWMQDDRLDPDGLLVVRLTRLQPDWTRERLRRTLAAGSPFQRKRALEWLLLAAAAPGLEEPIEKLARQAHVRAMRRGETELSRLAAEVLGRTGHTP